MTQDYSEFSFGYALTENLVRSHSRSAGPTSAPVFPSLSDEGSLGYDLELQLPTSVFFLQFKKARVMQTRRAFEVSSYGLPLHPPFMRVPITSLNRSEQHNLLCDLEGRYPSSVYYAASRAMDAAQFNRHYLATAVHLHTAYFTPRSIGRLRDDEPHYVSFNSHENRGWAFSDPRKIEIVPFQSVGGSEVDGVVERRATTPDVLAVELISDLKETLPPQLRGAEDRIRAVVRDRRSRMPDRGSERSKRDEIGDELRVARGLALIGLGVEMLVAQKRS